MPDVVLFGATGYTGRLTASALGRRGADFTVAGRDPDKLEAVAEESGAARMAVASVGDHAALSSAVRGARVLISCVGPFAELGRTAVDVAIADGVHYLDSCGEGRFVAELLARDDEARAAGVALAPAMGFDEVPADVAAALAADGLDDADLTITYAFPRSASNGTMRTLMGVLAKPGPQLVDGRWQDVRAAGDTRWSPMPPPLGPRRAMVVPTIEARFAPRHQSLRSCRTFATTGTLELFGARWGAPLLGVGMRLPGADAVLRRVFPSGGGPDEKARQAPWTVLAEASNGTSWRNVALIGRDAYGLTAETLAAGALAMADSGYSRKGVLTPVQAFGVEELQKELIDFGVGFEVYEPGT